ncbi:MAG: M28 family peptidase [Chloroflexi bacterium]|nr:M28 family peptidase [Chloroflexota bacterium]
MIARADNYLQKLCVEIPSRRVGSAGNRAATDFFAARVASFGFHVETPTFECIDWECDGVRLSANGAAFDAFASPYSLGCRVSAPLVAVSTVEELEAAEISGAVVLLRGEIAKEQLMPKNFAFYNPDEHKQIIALLEAKKPRAIIAATTRNPDLVGAMYPFALIEDGDFDIPSVFMTEDEGARLARYVGKLISLESRAARIPSSGCNVIARKGARQDRRVVLFAHIDAHIGSPGASDNASGVVALLLLAELLADYRGDLGIEIVAMNGEDYYAASGENQYVARNAGKFDEIVLGINLDDIGYHKGAVAYSLYDCPAEIARAIRNAFSAHSDLIEGPQWYQSDHGLFLMNQVPALAISSENLAELMGEITHTPKDRPEIVDATKLVTAATALRDLLSRLNHAR